jgi:MSHA biogenesis protein MshQ
MTAALQGTGTFKGNGNTATPDANMPVGIVAGEVLIAMLIQNQSRTVTSDSGYTPLDEITITSGGKLSVFWKLAGGSETACAFTLSGLADSHVGMARANGNNTTSPIDSFVNMGQSGAGASSLAVGGITTGENNELLILVEAASNAQTTFGAVAGMTEFMDGNNANNITLALAYEVRPTAGATGNRTITPAAAARLAGITFGIKELAAVSSAGSIGFLGS